MSDFIATPGKSDLKDHVEVLFSEVKPPSPIKVEEKLITEARGGTQLLFQACYILGRTARN
jgi:hypothetical protein